MYALKRDVAPIDPPGLVPGNVQLRPDKRPRPIVLRMNVGDCLESIYKIFCTMPHCANPPPAHSFSSCEGSEFGRQDPFRRLNVSKNPSSLVAPGGIETYTYIAEREGNHLLYLTAATTGGEGNGGSLAMGLFGSVNVQVDDAEWYRIR